MLTPFKLSAVKSIPTLADNRETHDIYQILKLYSL